MESGKNPRRLEDDTAEYLNHIDNTWIAMTESRREEELELMVTNVFEEVKYRLASAACDRRTHAIIEKLAYAASMSSLILLFDHLSAYSVFLARNRHSSHVLQAVLARFSYLIKSEGTSGMDQSRVVSSVLSLVEPVLREVSWLSMDLCASHVVRSALCVLTGMPVVGEKRSKNSRHQHSVGFTEPMDSLLVANKSYIDENACFSVPDDFHNALNQCLQNLCTPGFGKPGEGGDSQTARAKHIKTLHDLIEDPSGCAVFGLVLRICYNPNLLANGPNAAERLVRIVLEWPEERCMDLSFEDLRGAVFYRLSGNKSGSYFLEAFIECCDLYFLQEIVEGAVLRSSDEYANDPTANFILQSIFKRYCTELERFSHLLSDLLGEGNTIKAMKKSERELFKILGMQSVALISELQKPSLFSSLVQHKAGLVFWLIETSKKIDVLISIIGSENAEKYKLLSDRNEIPNLSGNICRTVLSNWTSNGVSLNDVLLSKLKVVSSSDAESTKRGKSNSSVPTPSSSSGSQVSYISIPTLTCKILGTMQSLSDANADIKIEVFTAISSLPLDTLTMLSTSGPMSKAILDSFFENCKNDELATKVIETLIPKIATLAGHYIGQHIVRKIFESTNTLNKEKILRSMVATKDYLVRSKEGRNSARILGLDLYQRNEGEWKRSLIRQERAMTMVAELEGDIERQLKGNNSGKTDKVYDEIDENLHNDIVDTEVGKTKRKRKRNRGGDPSKKKVPTKITF